MFGAEAKMVVVVGVVAEEAGNSEIYLVNGQQVELILDGVLCA